jgi:hypothetical protein
MNRPIHIDEYIKDKVELIELSYDESYWVDAEKLIAAQEKKKRRFFIFFILMLLAIVGLALVLKGYNTKELGSIKDFTNEKKIEISKSSGSKKQFIAFNQANRNKKLNDIKKEKTTKRKSNRALFFKDVISINKNISDTSSSKLNDSLQNDSLLKSPVIYRNISTNVPLYNLWLSEDDKKFKQKRGFIIGISGGTTINRNMELGYFAGLHLQKMHSRKMHSRIGAQFSALKYSDLKYNYTKTEYSFGEIVTKYTINSDVLYTIQVPISLHYRIYKHHTLHTGLVYSRYFAQKNLISSINGAEEKIESETGQSSDFRMDNFSLQFGYENIFWRRYQIGVSSQLSLFNPVKNISKFNNKSKDMLLESKLYMVYNLFKLKR